MGGGRWGRLRGAPAGRSLTDPAAEGKAARRVPGTGRGGVRLLGAVQVGWGEECAWEGWKGFPQTPPSPPRAGSLPLGKRRGPLKSALPEPPLSAHRKTWEGAKHRKIVTTGGGWGGGVNWLLRLAFARKLVVLIDNLLGSFWYRGRGFLIWVCTTFAWCTDSINCSLFFFSPAIRTNHTLSAVFQP